MSETTWAERIENASEAEQHGMGFGPFFVHLGHLTTLLEALTRTRRSSAVPAPWPVAKAPGWLKFKLDDDWALTAWCAAGGEWIFKGLPFDKRRVIHIPPSLSTERRNGILAKLDDPLQLIAAGEAFAFCDALFVIPEESFIMNSYRCHVPEREKLDIFIGFRGHPRQYPEIISPGVYRTHNAPNEESSRRYRRKVRVASNVVKQAVFERHKLVLTNVQARGVLQHYRIIGATDVLDLTYDVNIAKWFALNDWDKAKKVNRAKSFPDRRDPEEAFDEYSLVYTVVVRSIGMIVERKFAAELAEFRQLTFEGWKGEQPSDGEMIALPSRNLSPLWSARAERQSGFGLLGVGPEDDDAWGSVLAIHEHAFHPAFAPNGWDRIGGPTIRLGGETYAWPKDSSGLADHALPQADGCVEWIKTKVADLERRLGF
jgi:hypothetical protein